MNKGMKILIAYDGSICADDALNDLRRAGLPPLAEALIVSVAEIWLPIPVVRQSAKTVAATTNSVVAQITDTQSERLATLDETALKLIEAGEKLKSFFPEWEVKTEYLSGSPAATVINKAKEWDADLLIAGSHGRSGLNRLWFGSVSQKIANETSCSVRISRSHGNWKNGAPVRILIGLDGTPSAEAAVAEVAGRFWMTGSEVRLVVVLDKPDPKDFQPADRNRELGRSGHEAVPFAWVSEFVDRANKQLSRSELQVSEMIEPGDPKQIVVAEAEEWGADCIFIGAGGDQYARDRSLGSVSTAIVARAHCSVEIVRQ